MLDYNFLINALKNLELSIPEKNNIKAHMSKGIPLEEELEKKLLYIKDIREAKSNEIKNIFGL